MKKHNRNDNRTKTVIFKTTENQKESSPKNKIQFEELKNSPSSKNFSPMSKQPTKIEFQPNTENPTIKHSKTFIRKSAKKSMTSKIRNSLEIFDEIKPPLTSKSSSNNNKNIRVYIRFRPFNELESDLLSNNVGWATPIYKENNCVTIDTHKSEHEIGPTFKFDKVFPSSTEQKKVYETIGKEIISDVLDGYNGTIFAYGQSGSGKTFTMYGNNVENEETKGLIPRIIENIFDFVENSNENISFEIKMSVMQIYKEVIYDLLTGTKDLKIKENPSRGIFVENLSEVYLSNLEDFLNYNEIAQNNRKVGETKLNQTSSRSHSIMIIEITQTFKKENLIKKGTLNLVDLAGSEKISKTGAVGETLEEAKKINLSLSALGNVIHALTSINTEHVPYRDSKLTRILQESLGGNYKTSLIVTASPHSYHLEETISSLQFAQRAKTIKNKVKINIRYTYEELQVMIEKLNKKLAIANEKIKKLMNGEKVVVDEFNEDGCGKCEILKEEKKILEGKIESLLKEIKEKDEIEMKKKYDVNNNNNNFNDDDKKEDENRNKNKSFESSFIMSNESREFNNKIIEIYNELKDKICELKIDSENLLKTNENNLMNIKKINLNNFFIENNNNKSEIFEKFSLLTKESLKNLIIDEINYI